MAEFPLSPADRKIDELGAEGRIHTEADAQYYVQAFLYKLGVNKESMGQIETFKLRLARAEYLAVKDPSNRIPEALVADAFNRLMDDWGTPTWTRINNVDEIATDVQQGIVYVTVPDSNTLLSVPLPKPESHPSYQSLP
jgi:hypothetical protein